MRRQIVFSIIVGGIAFSAVGNESVPFVPVIPSSVISRDKAIEYVTLTQAMQGASAAYATMLTGTGVEAVSDELKSRQLERLREIAITQTQKAYSPLSIDAALAFLHTPAGKAWAEDSAKYRQAISDEYASMLAGFSDEIRLTQGQGGGVRAASADAHATPPPSATPFAPLLAPIRASPGFFPQVTPRPSPR